MGTYNVTIYPTKKAHILQDPNGPPERSFTTPWFFSNLGFFRVDVAVVRPESKQPKRNLSLSFREAKRVLKALANIIKLAEEKPG